MKKRYRNYTAKKYKLPKRILFFVICALIIFILALMLGNHLKYKMESADIDRTPVETYSEAETSAPIGIENGNAEHPDWVACVRAGYLDIVGAADTAAVRAAVDKLKADGFNAISFVCIKDGRFTFASKAVEEYSRLPASGTVVSFENLTEAVSYAKGKGMRTSALYEKGADEALDASVCAELASMGFDEIIICGYEELLSENGGEITPCIEYLKKIRIGAEGCAVSLSLSPAAYTYARNSYQIEKLFTYAEFMTIDMTGLELPDAENICGEIMGSFLTYMLRPVIEGEAEDIAKLLSDKSVLAVQYISSIPEPEPETTVPETVPGI